MTKTERKELRAKLVDRVIRYLKMDGAWKDVTNHHDKTAKKDLALEIETLVTKALDDYETLSRKR